MRFKLRNRLLAALLVFSMAVPTISLAAAEETHVSESQTPETPMTEMPATEIPETEEMTETETTASEDEEDTRKRSDKKDSKSGLEVAEEETKDTPPYVPGIEFTTVIQPEKMPVPFRFTTVKKVVALAGQSNVYVYAEPLEAALAVGEMAKNDICYLLQTVDHDWSYIESGTVRGFVKTEHLQSGEKATNYVNETGQYRLGTARELVDRSANPALAYTKTTVGRTLAIKQYAISRTPDLNIREEKSEEARIIGKLSEGALCYILADEGEDWIYVESGDVRGFVKSEYLLQGNKAKAEVVKTTEANFALAKELVEPKDNQACYYTFTSATKVAGEEQLEYLGNFTLTAYCSCPVCCGKWSGGPAAGGVYPVEGRTVAMGGVPFGTRLVINGEIYTVEDRGTPYGHVDIYLVHHQAAEIFGRQNADVYLLKEEITLN